ncbi:unnamed protein product [Onchocerca flexuosa]|uniref:VbhA domain-containing protein n=1 Tax=Onchocerca flexuosa TaxID=387005 RepID=A0A183HI83_9BILA|nr:unnamed protein product [Onchocerca flexuosa]
MFKRFYGDNITEEMALRFQKAATTLNMKISPAQIQGYLLLRKEDPQASIDDIATIMHTNILLTNEAEE